MQMLHVIQNQPLKAAAIMDDLHQQCIAKVTCLQELE
jgi:hypothetical protein